MHPFLLCTCDLTTVAMKTVPFSCYLLSTAKWDCAASGIKLFDPVRPLSTEAGKTLSWAHEHHQPHSAKSNVHPNCIICQGFPQGKESDVNKIAFFSIWSCPSFVVCVDQSELEVDYKIHPGSLCSGQNSIPLQPLSFTWKQDSKSY